MYVYIYIYIYTHNILYYCQVSNCWRSTIYSRRDIFLSQRARVTVHEPFLKVGKFVQPLWPTGRLLPSWSGHDLRPYGSVFLEIILRTRFPFWVGLSGQCFFRLPSRVWAKAPHLKQRGRPLCTPKNLKYEGCKPKGKWRLQGSPSQMCAWLLGPDLKPLVHLTWVGYSLTSCWVLPIASLCSWKEGSLALFLGLRLGLYALLRCSKTCIVMLTSLLWTSQAILSVCWTSLAVRADRLANSAPLAASWSAAWFANKWRAEKIVAWWAVGWLLTVVTPRPPSLSAKVSQRSSHRSWFLGWSSPYSLRGTSCGTPFAPGAARRHGW